MTSNPVLHVIMPGECPPAPRPRYGIIPRKKGMWPSIQRDVKNGCSMRELLAYFRPFPLERKNDPYSAWKKTAAWAMDSARNAYCGTKPFVEKGTPVEVWLLFVTPLAKSNERKRIQVIRDWCVARLKGDPDNLAKGPLDAGNGVVWHDDAQVAALRIEKVVGAQGEPARVEMMCWALERTEAQQTGFEHSRKEIRGMDLLFGSAKQVDEKWHEATENLLF